MVPKRKRYLCAVVSVLAAMLVSSGAARAAATNKVYWSSWFSDSICQCDPGGDDNSTEELVTGQNDPKGIAIDAACGKMYWADRLDGTINRANLDGSGVEEVSPVAPGDPNALAEYVALDPVHDKLYYTYNTVVDEDMNTAGRICRMDTDGSNIETLVSMDVFHNAGGIAVDPDDNTVFWTSGDIECADLDGSNRQTLFTDSLQPLDITVDAENDDLYWTNNWGTCIETAKIDGTGRTTVVTTLDSEFDDIDAPQGIAVDGEAGKLYWTDIDVSRSPFGIYEAQINGDNAQRIDYAYKAYGVGVGPVPEPATLGLLAVGGLALAVRRRR
jgi:DNA-binding beta-propeller fold protein YncE